MGGVLHLNIIRETRRRTWACLPTCNICTTSPRWPVVLYSHSLCFLSVFLSRARLPLSPLLSLSLSLSVLPRWSLVHDTPHTRSWVYGTGPQTRNRHPAERKPAAQTCCNRQVPLTYRGPVWLSAKGTRYGASRAGRRRRPAQKGADLLFVSLTDQETAIMR